jgi:hypothetical protein
MSSSPLQVTFLPLERTEKEIELGDIDIKPTSEAKCFHKKIMAYNLYRCVTPDPQETIIKHYQCFYKDFWH